MGKSIAIELCEKNFMRVGVPVDGELAFLRNRGGAIYRLAWAGSNPL